MTVPSWSDPDLGAGWDALSRALVLRSAAAPIIEQQRRVARIGRFQPVGQDEESMAEWFLRRVEERKRVEPTIRNIRLEMAYRNWLDRHEGGE